MIDFYYWPTPNGWKVAIALEEMELPYNLVPVNIGRGEQFSAEFERISPSSRMPAIVDHDPVDGGDRVESHDAHPLGAVVQNESLSHHRVEDPGRRVEEGVFVERIQVGQRGVTTVATSEASQRNPGTRSHVGDGVGTHLDSLLGRSVADVNARGGLPLGVAPAGTPVDIGDSRGEPVPAGRAARRIAATVHRKLRPRPRGPRGS